MENQPPFPPAPNPKIVKRRKIGYALTLLSLYCLQSAYIVALYLDYKGDMFKSALGAAMTLVPLALLTPPAIRRDLKTYQILALLAPWHFFVGGFMWLWDKALWGAWFCLWALVLQVGTILHNFQKRQKKDKKSHHQNPNPPSTPPKESQP